MKLDKQFFINKVLPILITSILSGIIAILQNILATFSNNDIMKTNPIEVGFIGASLKSAYLILKC